MAKNSKYTIHPDFAHYPVIPFPFNGAVVSLLNGLIHIDTFFRHRDLLNSAIKHRVSSADSSHFNVYQFTPRDVKPDEKLPAIVYYHGGAFVLTYASTHVVSMDIYAQRVRCRVFMVDYRLAPRYVFPKGFEDCFAALQWVASHAEKLNVDSKRIAIAGDSAGGTFSAGVAQKVKDAGGPEICGQLLIYPALDKSSSTESATTFLDTPLWNGVANKKMWEVYLKNFQEKPAPPYAAPADRADLAGLVPAYVENAEFDPLRDEAEVYAKRLQTAGVKMVFNSTKGTIHGYDTVFDSDISKAAMQQRLNFLKMIFQ
jgi:acetyl esterase/lipase